MDMMKMRLTSFFRIKLTHNRTRPGNRLRNLTTTREGAGERMNPVITETHAFVISLELAPIDVSLILVGAIMIFAIGYMWGRINGQKYTENKFIDKFTAQK